MDDLRIGEVTQVFPVEGKVKVVYEDDDNASCKLPILMFNNEYLMPEVGDTVLTMHRHSGSSEGFVLGKYYSEDNEVKADLEEGEIYRKDITENTFVSVNEEDLTKLETKRFLMKCDDGEFQIDNEEGNHIITNDMLIQVKNGTLEIESGGDMTVYSKEKLDIDCDDDIEAEADGKVEITAGGNMALKSGGTAEVEGSTVNLKSSGDIGLNGSFGSTSIAQLIQRIEALEQAIQNL